MTLALDEVLVRSLGSLAYPDALDGMRSFTAQRNESTPDEVWLLEHPPVYTMGQAADPAFGPKFDNGIPLVQTNRGGEITYHGPGQLVMYTLVDLARRGIKVKPFVSMLEQCVIDLIGPRAERKAGAPGVYVAGAKVAALGIRVTRGRAYHGLSLNVDMDLSPFAAIDPCGYPGLAVTQMKDLGFNWTPEEVGQSLARKLMEKLEHA